MSDYINGRIKVGENYIEFGENLDNVLNKLGEYKLLKPIEQGRFILQGVKHFEFMGIHAIATLTFRKDNNDTVLISALIKPFYSAYEKDYNDKSIIDDECEKIIRSKIQNLIFKEGPNFWIVKNQSYSIWCNKDDIGLSITYRVNENRK